MATRTWSNSSERGAVEQVAGRTWANSSGAGAHEDQAVAATDDAEGAWYMMPGQHQPIFEVPEVVGY